MAVISDADRRIGRESKRMTKRNDEAGNLLALIAIDKISLLCASVLSESPQSDSSEASASRRMIRSERSFPEHFDHFHPILLPTWY
jgi:hypothetical protein